MRCKPFALFPPFLAALSLTGCHRTQIQPLPGSAHPAYIITDLGTGVPSAINNHSQVVGHFPAGVFPNSNGFHYFHGCLWDKGKRIEMPTLGGWYSQASGTTDGGEVIGTATVAGTGHSDTNVTRTCVWDGHKLTNLDADPRFHGVSALHITKSGAIYAASPPQRPRKQFHLWFYPAGFHPGARRDLGVIGGPKINPLFINDNGMTVGTWDTGEKRNATDTIGVQRAFVWHRGDKKLTDLGTFGGRDSAPAGLNNSGQVVGDAMLTDDPVTHMWRDHAFLWDKGKMQDLGTLPGGHRSRPCAINSAGQIVGYSDLKGSDTSSHPVLWEHGQIKDLSVLIPKGTQWVGLDGAAGINDQGQIVGDGVVSYDEPKKGTYQSHAYLLTPR